MAPATLPELLRNSLEIALVNMMMSVCESHYGMPWRDGLHEDLPADARAVVRGTAPDWFDALDLDMALALATLADMLGYWMRQRPDGAFVPYVPTSDHDRRIGASLLDTMLADHEAAKEHRRQQRLAVITHRKFTGDIKVVADGSDD